MRKQLLMKTFLVAVSLLVGTSAWAATTTIASWNFVARSAELTDKTSVGYSATTVRIGSTDCNLGTGFEDGLAFQGAGSWIYRTAGYLYQGNGGGRILAILNLKAGDVITVVAGANFTASANCTSTADNVFSVTADGNVGISLARYNNVYSIVVTREVSDLESPTYSITGTNGIQRQVALSCITDGATLKYNTTNDKSAAGWTTYSAPFYTSEGTLYAYSEKNSNTSDVITITTGAGSAITLNAPAVSKTNFADGVYTISITSNQSSLDVVPSAPVVKYTINDGDVQTYSAPLSVDGGKTVKTWVESTGYTSSDIITCSTEARPNFANYVQSWTQDYRNVTTGGTGAYPVVLSTTDGGDFQVDSTPYYNIVGYNNSGTVSVDLNTNVGLAVPTNFYLRKNGNNSGILQNAANQNIGIKNLNVGDYIVITTNGNSLGGGTGAELKSGMSTASEYVFQATATEAAIRFYSGTYAYVYSITVYSSTVTKAITAAGWATYCSPFALDFSEDIANLTDVYIVTGSTGSSLELTSVKGGTVPANTGLLIEGTAGDVVIPIAATSATDVSANKLVGVTAETALAAEGGYVLMGSPSVGFYKNSNAFTVGANTAYLPIDFDAAIVPSDARNFYGFGEVTGIGATLKNKEIENKEVYNLKGQRVAAPTRGLYIQNGKKVVVK